jgi:hypothetical protein
MRMEASVRTVGRAPRNDGRERSELMRFPSGGAQWRTLFPIRYGRWTLPALPGSLIFLASQ